jgi:hypothetical protein
MSSTTSLRPPILWLLQPDAYDHVQVLRIDHVAPMLMAASPSRSRRIWLLQFEAVLVVVLLLHYYITAVV